MPQTDIGNDGTVTPVPGLHQNRPRGQDVVAVGTTTSVREETRC